MSKSTCNRQAVTFLAMVCIASQAIAADHRDGPRVVNSASTLGALDINDLYVFVSPANPNNTVLVFSTGGLDVGIISPPFFFPGAAYEFRISNNGLKTDDEIVFQAIFSDPDRFGRQNFTLRGPKSATHGKGHGKGSLPLVHPVIAQGVTGRPVAGRLGIKVQAGIFDDPFFFDLGAFGKFRTAVQEGKGLAERVAPFLPPNIPRNGFTKNTLAIVIELPRTQLQSSPNNPNISVWLRSLTKDGGQFDRMGLPAINTAVLFGFGNMPNLQDDFNSLTPADDLGLIGLAAQRINLIYGLPLTGSAPNGGPNAMQLAATVLPDVMPFNTLNPTGFLNGRRLTDDVIDAELSLLTGGALMSDRVDNDSTFLNQFPYLAPANPP